MISVTNDEKIELCVLSHLVQHPSCARRIIDDVAITDDDFNADDRRAVFRRLACEPNSDSVVRLFEARKLLPALAEDDFTDFFLGLAPTTASIRYDFRALVSSTHARDLNREIANIMARAMEPEVRTTAIAAATKEVDDHYIARRDRISTLSLPTDDAPAPSSATPADDHASRYAIDESLLNMPGFVNEVTEFTLQTAHRPNRILAFAGALALLAHLAGRKFFGPRDAFPNLYLIALAESSAGKDHPRKVIKKFAHEMHISSSVVQSFASGQGLEDALLRMPTMLCEFDEFDSVLRELKSDHKGANTQESLWRTLLTVFSTSGSTYSTRIRSTANNKAPGGEIIDHPSFTVFATATPDNFYDALSPRALTGGLLGRCLVFEASKRGEANEDSGLESRGVPFFIKDALSKLVAMHPQFNEREAPPPRRVDYASPEAKAAMKRIDAEADALRNDKSVGQMERSVWGRSSEHVLKFALLHAISANVDNPSITLEAVEWSWRLVKCIQERMMLMAREYSAESEPDAKRLAVLRMIRDAGEKGVMRSDVLKPLHLTSSQLDVIQKTLEESGDIIIDRPPTKRGTRYRISERACK